MKLQQIKAINASTVTPEMAECLFNIIGLLRTKPETILFLKEDYWGRADNGNGGSSRSEWNDPEFKQDGYTREFRSLHISRQRDNGQDLCIIWANGRGQMYNYYNKGALRSFYSGDKSKGIPSKEDFFEEFTSFHEYGCDPIELIQFYLDNGFYTITA